MPSVNIPSFPLPTFLRIAAATVLVSFTLAGAAVAQETQDVQDTSGDCVVESRLSWGVRESFRSYISGSIANGGWTTDDGAVYSDGAFVFPGSGGTVTLDGDTVTGGALPMAGSVHFTGHDGTLDTRLAAPEIRLSGSDGTLVASVTSNDTEGAPHDYGRIEVATLAVEGESVSDGELAGDTTVTLTQEGADALGSFYDPGAEMDPLTFRAALSDGCDSAAAGLDEPMPEDEGDGGGTGSGTGRGTGDGGVTFRDAGDAGTSENALVSFVTTPSRVIPVAGGLLVVLLVVGYVVRADRRKKGRRSGGSDSAAAPTGGGE